MHTSVEDRPSIFGLIGQLRQQFTNLLRQEMQLAKREMAENIARFTRNTVTLLVAAFLACTGLAVLLAGGGFFLANVFVGLGWPLTMACGTAFAIIGLFIALVSALLILKASHALSAESLAPKKTLESIDDMAGTHFAAKASAPDRKSPKPERPSSDELQEHVEHTQENIQRTVGRIGERIVLTRQTARQKAARQPARNLALALCAGVMTGRILRQVRQKKEERAAQG
jgi:hypothetical protein